MSRLILQGNFLTGRPLGQTGDGIDARRLGLSPLPGAPLPQAVQRRMEQVFGHDFADVRIHAGRQAQFIGAQAFTIGGDIYFAPGQYQPDLPRGQKLLGHELAHVIQQRQGRVRAPAGNGIAIVVDPPLEREAERLADMAMVALQRKATMGGMPANGVIQPLVYLRKHIGAGNIVGTVQATEDQLVDWVASKLPAADKPNIRHCVQYFMTHNGKTSGGGTGYAINGRTVFHISHGRMDRDDGCTLFFTVYPGVNTTAPNVNHRGLIVAIGQHSGNASYRIRWHDTSWTHGVNIDL